MTYFCSFCTRLYKNTSQFFCNKKSVSLEYVKVIYSFVEIFVLKNLFGVIILYRFYSILDGSPQNIHSPVVTIRSHGYFLIPVLLKNLNKSLYLKIVVGVSLYVVNLSKPLSIFSLERIIRRFFFYENVLFRGENGLFQRMNGL